MSVETGVDWRDALFRRRALGVRLDLAPIQAVLAAWVPDLSARLGAIEVVQVVGTNGKGSTAALIDHGLRTRAPSRGPVGLYTSPHLERIGERVRVDGRAIDDDQIHARIVELGAVEDALSQPLSFFEVLTAIALRQFLAAGCQTLILEAGLGARLDATTAIAADHVAITRIALDHQGYLGDTLAAIAAEKAAAIRGVAPVLSVTQDPRVHAVLEARARACGAPLTVVAAEARAPAGLPGLQQRPNAGRALAVLRSLGVEATLDDLDSVAWPGRLERIETHPGAGQLWLDVAHNLDGIEALCAAVRDLDLDLDRVVVGAMADKDGGAMVERLEALAPVWWVPPARAGAFELGRQGRAPIRRFAGPDDPQLLAELGAALDGGERVLVCGSHQLVGPIRAAIRGEACEDPRLRDPVTRKTNP